MITGRTDICKILDWHAVPAPEGIYRCRVDVWLGYQRARRLCEAGHRFAWRNNQAIWPISARRQRRVISRSMQISALVARGVIFLESP